jgi:hypothetical protein
MKRIFLISGYAQHGKDSTANFLKQKLHGNSLIIHNADYLKYIAKQYFGWDGNKDEKGRTLLQQLGTEKTKIELKKSFFWIEKVCDIIELTQNLYDYFLVPDTRFLSEIYYPLAKFPYHIFTIRVVRLNFDNGLTKCQKNHISETELSRYDHDYKIVSESGLDKLEAEVDIFIKFSHFND